MSGLIKKTLKRQHLILLFFYFCACWLLFSDAITQMISSAMTAEGSHGVLIVAVCFYLLWLQRARLFSLSPEPAFFRGAVLVSVACFFLFAGKIGSIMVLQQLALIPFFLGSVLLFIGVRAFWILFVPISYLVFLTGIIDLLLWNYAIHFQLVSAKIAVFLLPLINMPVVHSGILIHLPHISLEVVRTCSGVSHIVSLMALSVPLAIMSSLPPVRMAVLIVSSFLIGIFANGLRIALIGVYALFNEGADLHGPNETLYVTFIFFFGMVFLIFLSHLLSRGVHTLDAATDDSDHQLPENSFEMGKTLVFFIVAVLVTAGFNSFYSVNPVFLSTELTEMPTSLAGFSSVELNGFDENIRPHEADQELNRRYKDSNGNAINLYVGYYALQRENHKVIEYRRDWMHYDGQPFFVSSDNKAVEIIKSDPKNRPEYSSLYFWYIIDDRIITSQYVGKLYTFLDGLLKRRTNGAVVVVQTRSSQEEVMPFLEELVPEVMGHLRAGKTVSGER